MSLNGQTSLLFHEIWHIKIAYRISQTMICQTLQLSAYHYAHSSIPSSLTVWRTYRMGKNKHYQVLPIRKKPYQLKMSPVESPWNFGP